MRVLLASHTAPGGAFTVGSHHLAREFRALGHQVCHLSTPVSFAHLVHAGDPEVRRRAGLALRRGRSPDPAAFVPFTLVPMSAGPRLNGPRGLRTALPRLRSDLRRIGFASVDALIVDQPLLAGIEEVVSAGVVVYRSTDLVDSPAKVAGEARLVAAADAVVGTSRPVLDHLQALRPDLPGLLLVNGVEFSRFAGRDQALPRSGVVYVGALDKRFDWAAVAAMAAYDPDVPITLHGPSTGPAPALPANVEVAGPLPYAQLPDVLAGARVGLLPLVDSPANRGRSPMKLYEYLAAGLQVVSTLPDPASAELPGVRHATAAGAGAALADAVAAGPNTDGIAIARTMDWPGRASVLADFVAGVLSASALPTARGGDLRGSDLARWDAV